MRATVVLFYTLPCCSIAGSHLSAERCEEDGIFLVEPSIAFVIQLAGGLVLVTVGILNMNSVCVSSLSFIKAENMILSHTHTHTHTPSETRRTHTGARAHTHTRRSAGKADVPSLPHSEVIFISNARKPSIFLLIYLRPSASAPSTLLLFQSLLLSTPPFFFSLSIHSGGQCLRAEDAGMIDLSMCVFALRTCTTFLSHH